MQAKIDNLPTSLAPSQAQAYHVDFALHTLGWKAFQDLCEQVLKEELKCTVAVYREAQDGGQDAVFQLSRPSAFENVGTAQCKFSSKGDQRLRASDITDELAHVEQLVAKGMASVYYFITSMGIDADVAYQIRTKLCALGVVTPVIVGKEWLLLKIKGSARLRALVPRVYGLGDLSTIIDERCAAQTHALLGDHRKALSVYVPTESHLAAVDILSKHKIVLLLGAPATGKTTLAAILATMAVDKGDLQVFKCDGPLELRQHWNPHEPKRLYWVDDAFGANLLMSDYVNAWMEFMPKLKVALEQGCHFILTSRTHIWNEAHPRIGSRNHTLLATRAAVVDVGKLSSSEREQILYNHLKAGTQPPFWKALISDHLPLLAQEERLLPELARRLADKDFTGHIRRLPEDLLRFVAQPQKFLVQTFEELSDEKRAALTLVFLAKSKLPVHLLPVSDAELVAENYGVTKAAITESLRQLDGSLVVRRKDGDKEYWAFWHPTFADAISEILSKRPDLVDVYVRGVRIETLLSEVVCEGASYVRDAVMVPVNGAEKLVDRLLETPDEPEANERLFAFLNRRVPQSVLKSVLERDASIAGRKGDIASWRRLGRSEEILLRTSAHKLALLSEDVRGDTVYTLANAATYSNDGSFLIYDDILALFKPSELIDLAGRLVAVLHTEFSRRISECAEDADPDGDIDDQFDTLSQFLSDTCLLMDHSFFCDKHLELMDELERAKESVKARKSVEDEEEESFFNSIPRAAKVERRGGRSIFSDVAE
ncbi:MAG: hypothetical protein Q7V20_15130 [Aquabacterium sp.]|uniref:nSTAND3 domain-containing NTPase n=1 Tax=Aquabacterium sp. TaxID=1872578 RepID=UPI00272191A6|nr:hypothetical protein [Aquabacterium sp.]MDO9004779.1 hypothetical protein [Aquabacterium sp.]